jgi:hypothetical protein
VLDLCDGIDLSVCPDWLRNTRSRFGAGAGFGRFDCLRYSLAPLATALGRYGDATGGEALFDTSLADGRISGAVSGQSTPDEALRKLLMGTGLYARFVTEKAFVLLPARTGDARQKAPSAPASTDRYHGLIQRTLLDALCRSGGARPGNYNVVIVFQIDATGDVEAVKRIGSTGMDDIDQSIEKH